MSQDGNNFSVDFSQVSELPASHPESATYTPQRVRFETSHQDSACASLSEESFQSQSSVTPEVPSQDQSQVSSSQVEEVYLRLRRESETFVKEHPVASKRSKADTALLQKIKNRMKKISKRMDVGHLKRNSNTTSMTPLQGKGRSDSEEPKQKKSKKTLGDLECSVCAKSFTKINNLNHHIEQLHTAVEGGVVCTKDFCDLAFGTMHEMFRHRDNCIFTCPVCGLIITRNGKAAGHKKKCT